MSRQPHGPPKPGLFAGLAFRLRINPAQQDHIRDELLEMYEHRKAAAGQASADRWLRREYRRLAFRLLIGGRLGEATAPAEPTRRATLFQDVRHSLRGLLRAPTFSTAIVATVGIGIGGTSLVFAIVHSVLVSPLPYPGGERMVVLRTVENDRMWGTSMADVHALTETPPGAFDQLAAFTYRTSRIQHGSENNLVRT